MVLIKNGILLILSIILKGGCCVEYWTNWSACDVSCGHGFQYRDRVCKVESECTKQTRPCHELICPSYLSWPRIHFGGNFVMDSSTINNDRCNFDNRFIPSLSLSKSQIGLQKVDGHFSKYKPAGRNWNPDGTGHFYFDSTTVTSFCASPSNCSTETDIVGLSFKETQVAQVTTLDPDFQIMVEIWGLKIKIPGILEAKFRSATGQQDVTRFEISNMDKGYSVGNMARIKSKLDNVKWGSDYYKERFNNAEQLSISFVMDNFNQFTKKGRVSGTIGLTSSDDADEIYAGRSLTLNKDTKSAPLFVDQHHKIITFDLSTIFSTDENGVFQTEDIALGIIINCRLPYLHPAEICARTNAATTGERVFIIEKNLSGKYLDRSGRWYTHFGGVIDVDLSHIHDVVLSLIDDNRLALVKQIEGLEPGHFYHQILVKEPIHGIQMGVFNRVARRLNVGHDIEVITFASKFGKPLTGADMNFLIPVSILKSDNKCGSFACNGTLSFPKDAISIVKQNNTTNEHGLISHSIKPIKSPGSPRGCNIDGQLYPMHLTLKYEWEGINYTYLQSETTLTPKKDLFKADHYFSVQYPFWRLYDQVEVKACPTWMDVKDIFLQYYNLYPVMWKNGIVDLHSYQEVVQKIILIQIAMFETDFEDSRYMPASRDLSLSKQKLIWNWILCGMKFKPENSKEENEKCSPNEMSEMLKKIKRMIQQAILIELTTIPPYLTSYLSLKLENARNNHVGRILKVIFTEEMQHMTFGANLLNAVGGIVNLTNIEELPSYPAALGHGDYFDIAPTIFAPLEKLSISLIKEVFVLIESPSPPEYKEELQAIAEIWSMLHSTGRTNRPKVAHLLQYYSKQTTDNKTEKSHHQMKQVRFANEDIEGLPESTKKLNMWNKINQYTAQKIEAKDILVTTIGSFYTNLIMHITYLESCEKVNSLSAGDDAIETSIFVGDISRQMNSSYWYNPAMFSAKKISNAFLESQWRKENLVETESQLSYIASAVIRDPLPQNWSLPLPIFPIHDLDTAIEAILEIVYEGEGASPCSAFTNSDAGKKQYMMPTNSHYVKFLEIANGRSLVKTNFQPGTSSNINCLQIEAGICNLTRNEDNYCFTGDPISFYPEEVWPIVSNPTSSMYAEGSEAKSLNDLFNVQYTRLLWCLQDAFGGKPHFMRACMADMYDLVIIGKQLVRTPISPNNHSNAKNICEPCHATPTWEFIRGSNERNGLHT